MFWINGALIERSNMAGKNRTTIVSASQGLVAPTKLVIDMTTSRLYWLDPAANTVGCVYLNGSGVKTWNLPAFSGYSALAIQSVS